LGFPPRFRLKNWRQTNFSLRIQQKFWIFQPVFSGESSTLSYVPGCTSILWLTSLWHSSGINLKVALDIPCHLELSSAFHRKIFAQARWSEKKGWM
jgi:hypothetical protein